MLQEALEGALAEKEALLKKISALEESIRESDKVQADQVRQIERLKAQVSKLHSCCVLNLHICSMQYVLKRLPWLNCVGHLLYDKARVHMLMRVTHEDHGAW
jgi:hypothetical protein